MNVIWEVTVMGAVVGPERAVRVVKIMCVVPVSWAPQSNMLDVSKYT